MRLISGQIFSLILILTLSISAKAWLSKTFNRRLQNVGKKLGSLFNKKTTTPDTTPNSECVPTYGYDPARNWCYGTYCDENGQLIAWDNFNCKSTPPSSPPTSSPTPVTTPNYPVGCFYNGQYYPPGSEISRGEDRASNWCWIVLCDTDGNILHGDDFNCFPTESSSSPPTSLPTSSPTTSTPTSSPTITTPTSDSPTSTVSDMNDRRSKSGFHRLSLQKLLERLSNLKNF